MSVAPVLIALFFNLMAPVLSVALPEAAPEQLKPQVTEAAVDPVHVSLTLEGCREPSVDLEATNFICADADYTTGNLGKTWNELDLVPHRLTTTLGEQDAATETYTLGVTADFMDGGVPGYDVLSAPVLNVAKSDPSCSVVVGPQTVITPGVGGTDSSLGRLLTITQEKGTTCVFDWVERLALGSHDFPGSSLHTNRTNQLWSTQGIGAADVSIPVKEILPQEISKDMTAERGQAYGWSIEKSADPATLNFANTCLDTAGARSATVDITITWTRTGPTASGDTMITTNIYATNPAHRSVLVAVTDRIYEGAGQTTLLDEESAGPVSIAAGAEDVLLMSHSFVYTGSATTFNDVATASYTDEDLGIPVPGTTTATASATTTASTDPITNSSVLVTDTESITGDGLSFSVAAPSVGAFTGDYVAGTETTGPVGWQTTATNSGSVTFTKTVMVDEPRITTGTLSDTATVVGDGQTTLDSDSESVGITTDALVGLTINKTIPAGSLRSGESVTFTFDVTGPGGFDEDASITFNFGDPLTKSTTLQDLEPGEYTVSEQPQANWADHVDQVETITLPDCDGSVAFNNSTLAPDLDILKTADDASVTAGDPIGFEIELTNSASSGTGVAKDATLDDALPFGDGIDWEIVAVTGIGGFDPTGLCSIVGAPPDEDLDCNLGDLAPGEGVRVKLSSDTTGDSCGEYPNTAKAAASNHDEITWSASTAVLCPELEIEKTTSTPVINAGDMASYTITISNLDGDAPATGVDLVDQLPSGLTWTDDSDDCTITDGVLSCLDLTIPDGAEFSVTVTGTTDAGECPSILNRATFTSGNAGSGASDPEGEGTLITVNCPDLEVVKEQVDENGEPTNEPVSAGDVAYFEIHVTNSGDGNAYGVELFDEPESGTWTVLDDGGFECPAEIGAGGGTCTADVLVPGTYTIFLSYETDVPDCGLLVNDVQVSADNEPAAWVNELNSDSASIIVECPGLNIIKRQVDENGDPTNEPIVAGETAYFEILVWNSDDEGIGTAHDVVVTENAEDLPDGVSWSIDAPVGVSCASSVSTEEPQSFTCDLGDLEPGDEVSIIVSGLTDRADCGALVNTARVDGSNNDDEVPPATATILVSCPEIALDKENDAVGSVLPGTTVEYTLTLTVSDEGLENGEATDVVAIDEMPIGLEDPTDISDGGEFDAATRTITWDLGDLGEGSYTLTYLATVAGDVENGEELVNAAAATSTNSQCPDLETLGPECEDDSTVIVRVPTLVIDKLADVEVITITGEDDDLVANPEVVTWTLTYTLTNGPVTNAVITDEVPVGFEFLDASDGGTLVDGAVIWTFATLTESGSVTFRTTVDPETISRVAPTVNVAVIDSDETEPDEGEDSVTVVVEPPPLGGTPTPRPSLPDTASGFGMNGEPVTIPVELLVAFFIGSLGALTLANVKARSRRR